MKSTCPLLTETKKTEHSLYNRIDLNQAYPHPLIGFQICLSYGDRHGFGHGPSSSALSLEHDGVSYSWLLISFFEPLPCIVDLILIYFSLKNKNRQRV